MSETSTTTRSKKHPAAKILRIAIISIGVLSGIVILMIAGISLYLTPERLTRIVNGKASHYLKADVRAQNICYSLWTTFPLLHIHADSLRVISRTLLDLPESSRRQLPPGSDFLASTGRIDAAVNILDALRGEIRIISPEIDAPEINLVSVNDSVNNFAIFPSMTAKIRMPHISLDSLLIPAPIRLSYFNADPLISADTEIKSLRLSGSEKRDAYHLAMTASAHISTSGFSMAKPLSVCADGYINLAFDPFAISLSGFAIDADGTHTTTDLGMTLDKDLLINTFSTSISTSNILAEAEPFKSILPSWMDYVSGTLPIELEFNLTEPCRISGAEAKRPSLKSLPPFSLSADMSDGDVTLTSGSGKKAHISRISLSAFLDCDSRNPLANNLIVRDLSFSAGDSRVDANGEIRNILADHPSVKADIICDADLSVIASMLPADIPVKAGGRLSGDITLSGLLSTTPEGGVKDIGVEGSLRSPVMTISDATHGMVANLSGFRLDMSTLLPSLKPSTLTSATGRLAVSAKKATVSAARDSFAISLRNLSLDGKIGAGKLSSTATLSGNIRLNAGEIGATMPGFKTEVKDMTASLDAKMRHIPWSSSTAMTGYASEGDSIIAARTDHTPLYLMSPVTATVQTALSLIDLDGEILAKEGMLLAQAYPAVTSFSGLQISTDLDTVGLSASSIRIRDTEAGFSGKIKRLRSFLSSATPSPLEIDLDAHFSDVDINQLAATYYDGVAAMTGHPADFTVSPPGPFTAADSMCVVIPRNLTASVRLHSDKAEYQGWTFHPLSTELSLHNGVARIGNLRIGSGFCKATVDWTYSTANLENIFMHLKAGVDNFNFTGFFKEFPSLLGSTPELTSLSGSVSAVADGRFMMYPSMFLNTSSLSGQLTLSGSGLEYQRDSKIRRITHLMLIGGDAPLKVDNFTLHGSFHDNLLQIDPFTIRCGGYDLMIGGVNNLQGEIYYHLGLMRSPLHFPFGINIVGNYRHPELRFGGKGIKDGRERAISSDLREDTDINIMRQLRRGWLLFIENAAKYDAENNHGHVFNVH